MHPFLRSFLSLLVLASISIGFADTASADYSMPTLAVGLQGATLVEATVTKFDDQKHAVLQVHEVWSGEGKPTKGYNVQYTCFGGPWSTMGVQAGKRYLFVMVKDRLLEERSFFEIIETRSGRSTVKMDEFYQKWFELPKGQLSKAKVKKHLTTLAKRHAAPPKP